MEKIVLKAQNEDELKNMINRSLTLKEDETYRVKVLKYPKKILFVSIKGEYEIEIVKKSELKNNEVKVETEKSKAQNEYKIEKKEKIADKIEDSINQKKIIVDEDVSIICNNDRIKSCMGTTRTSIPK